VSTDGLVTAIAAGTANISVTTEDGAKQSKCAVTVSSTAISVTSVSLNKTATSIYVGNTEQLTPTIVPSSATNQSVSWSSSAEGIATVSSSGLVEGVSAGTATITVTTDDGSKTAICEVTVSAVTISVTGVTLNKSDTSLVAGNTELLTPTIEPSNATNQNVSWHSSSEAVATVSTGGLVTAVSAGTATITVTTEDGSKTDSCDITVSAATVSVTGVTLNKNTTSIAYGGTEQLTATVAPADATNKNVTWSSSDESKATVSTSGLVTAVSAGTATITVTTQDGSKTATCDVAVTLNITGTWEISFDGHTLGFIFNQSGNDVTAVYLGQFNDSSTVTSLSVDIDQFNFVFVDADEAATHTINGTITNNDTITGTWSATGGETWSSSVTMTKISSSIVIPVVTIPAADIIVDGAITDWASVSNFLEDSTGESSVAGTDIEWVKTAVNSAKTKMYVLMKMASGTINQGYSYSIELGIDSSVEKDVYCLWNTASSSWNGYGFAKDESSSVPIDGLNAVVSISGQYIEFSFDLSPLTLSNQFNARASVCLVGEGGSSTDETDLLFGYAKLP